MKVGKRVRSLDEFYNSSEISFYVSLWGKTTSSAFLKNMNFRQVASLIRRGNLHYVDRGRINNVFVCEFVGYPDRVFPTIKNGKKYKIEILGISYSGILEVNIQGIGICRYSSLDSFEANWNLSRRCFNYIALGLC